MSSFSSTITATETFTLSHAKHITARIKSDLKRLNQLYPEAQLTESTIDAFHDEATTLLRDGYLKTVSYGFKKEVESFFGSGDEWALALKYEVINGDLSGGSDMPGGITPNIDIAGAKFYSFLNYTNKWRDMDESERRAYKSSLPITRTNGEEPTAYWHQSRSYGSGGRIVNRYTTF